MTNDRYRDRYPGAPSELLSLLEARERLITELEGQIQDHKSDLQEMFEERHRMLRTLAHEVRNPLTAAQMMLDQLSGADGAVPQRTLDDSARQDATDASRCVTEALNIVSAQLEMASLERAQRTQPRIAPVRVFELLEGLGSVARARRADDAIQISFVCDPDVPVFDSDAYLLTQILRNLLGNALKFTDAGTIQVRASWDEGKAEVRFAVTDSGIGIAPADQARVFDEFVQVEAAQLGRRHGTGLGLAISRGLVNALGGRLELESSPGQGSTFTAVVPVKLVAQSPAGAALPSPPRAVSSVGRAGDS